MSLYLDIFYEILHILVVVVNLFFWWPRYTRTMHFYLINLTAFSWLVMGAYFGLGYCFLTDWHWEVKSKLNYQDLPNDFISYALLRYFNINWPEYVVNTITALCFVGCFVLAWFLKLNKKYN